MLRKRVHLSNSSENNPIQGIYDTSVWSENILANIKSVYVQFGGWERVQVFSNDFCNQAQSSIYLNLIICSIKTKEDCSREGGIGAVSEEKGEGGRGESYSHKPTSCHFKPHVNWFIFILHHTETQPVLQTAFTGFNSCILIRKQRPTPRDKVSVPNFWHMAQLRM